MIRRLFILLSLTLLALPAAATELVIAQATPRRNVYIEALKTPGHALILRHALAPGHGDPSDFNVSNCVTQRNLNDEGRAQSVRIGDWLRERGVAPKVIHTSPWCRCIETAELMNLGPVVKETRLTVLCDHLSPKRETLAKLRVFSRIMRIHKPRWSSSHIPRQ